MRAMTNITNELMYEVLKSIQTRMDGIERALKDLAHGQIRLREDLNSFHRDAIRLEVHLSELDTRLDRIEKRMETVRVN